MAVTFIGVRHHSPACARLVHRTIERLRPAYVLVEGPADFNERLDELLLGHEPPIAIFSHHRNGPLVHTAWSPLCAHSPEWVALNTGRACGAELRFIDLPVWHHAMAGRRNRYADADERYAEVTRRLCRELAVDGIDALWDHLFEIPDEADLAERLEAYFDLLRGESEAGSEDTARERYMARWIRAAEAAADGRPVVVVTGGFHTPALRALVAEPAADPDDGGWPQVPRPPEGSVGGSFLVPFSFRRLDSFSGYQSGMPSPEYYHRLWEHGPREAADGLTEAVVRRLRKRGVAVSTADLIAARALTEGLARLRGHRHPGRTDLLDGLVSALVTEDLEDPLPWSSRGPLRPDAHPVVAEMVAALSGDRTGRLHPDTPAPPLVERVRADLERLGLEGAEPVTLRLTDREDLERSRLLHRLRVLGVPGFDRESGPDTGTEEVLEEQWTLHPGEHRLPALIEAGAYGATPADAALAALEERAAEAGGDAAALADVLFDAVFCGCGELPDKIAESLSAGLDASPDIGALGRVLETMLALWRHDRVLGLARSPLPALVIERCVTRLLWLVESVRGGPAPAEPARLAAMAAVRDALLHAAEPIGLDREAALAVAARVGADPQVPPDLRGAAFGLCWALGEPADPARAVLGVAAPATLGDWLAGLFALAREQVLAAEETGERTVLTVLDTLIGELTEEEFLVALPALRQAFGYFPPREREIIARRLLELRGVRGSAGSLLRSARSLLRTTADPMALAEAGALEKTVDRLLTDEGLITT
ncbi:DUF5682 family protein [Thermomonospora catenispora]|uniref:DUF5682 family protein n=1 Tax=Thermomonospora catenispora TaxID=2493090 RepID=UPI001123B042|nr:DUF5682 family protein [Thermomonospora catenispora]TNY37255.1 hypothetical protein EIO00_08945 [Thermomonospora catenispora]